ncbi:Kelch-like protein 17 [Halotydeus destructor]|nr:Kelch-like protein 17 [Halotydeus destructor]
MAAVEAEKIADSPVRQVNYVNSQHLNEAFSLMNTMRRSGQLSDVTLDICGQHVKCHRLVLAATSAYFSAMFNNEMAEKNKSLIELHDVDKAALDQLVDYAYTGNICISEHNVQTLLPAASLLQISSVREACCKFLLRQLDPTNCLGIRHFADAHSCDELHKTSHQFTLEKFAKVCLTEEFLHLAYEELEGLISSNQLNVASEEIVFDAVMSWIKHKPKERESYLGNLLQHVRLPLTNRLFLLKRVDEEPLIQGNQQGKDLLIEAMKYHLNPEHRPSMASIRTQQRKPEGLRTYLFAIGGGSLFAIHNECEFYDGRIDQWAVMAPTIHRRSRAGVVALDRQLYAVGGYDGTKDLSSCESFDPIVNGWQPITSMGTKRSCLGIATLNGLIYVSGGYDGASCLNSVERYDPLVTTWSSVAAMETRRRYCRLAVLGGSLLAVGGYDGSNYQSTMERHDPREAKWYTMPQMLSRRSSCGVSVLDDKLYVVGGNDGSLCMATVERFDLKLNTWETVAPMNSRRSTHEVIAADGYLYAIGGNDGSSSLNTVERYDPHVNKWFTVNSMLLRRSSVGASVMECPEITFLSTPRQESLVQANSEMSEHSS